MAKSSSLGRWIFISFAAVCVAGLIFVLYEPNVTLGGSPREDRIAEFREELNLTEGQRLVWSPQLVSETYAVGTVFPSAGLGHAVTTKCNAGEAKIDEMKVRLGEGKHYEITPDLGIDDVIGLNLDGAKSLEYVLSIEEARVLPAYSDLVRALASDPECLAMIANKPVMVLYGVYRGDEAYAVTRTFTGNLRTGNWKEIFGAGGSVGGDGNRKSDFSREDTSLIWSLTKVYLKDERFPNGPGTESFRLQKANELLRQETDYASRAENSVEFYPPSDDEVKALLEVPENVTSPGDDS
ncbi:hypothetical protein [Roseibium sp.]|uniref:hypothetical protein n=1 Tax=Roseibium sp. TaxID=1936156 RepID=UPI003A96E9F1